MKAIIFLVLVTLSICDYDLKKAVYYAKDNCEFYNSTYKFSKSNEPSNFISQCLIAGGQSLEDCSNRMGNGVIKGTSSLIQCLMQHKWIEYELLPRSIKPGWIVTDKQKSQFIGIITDINGGIKYCSHGDIYSQFSCDEPLEKTYEELYYYYAPPN